MAWLIRVPSPDASVTFSEQRHLAPFREVTSGNNAPGCQAGSGTCAGAGLQQISAEDPLFSRSLELFVPKGAMKGGSS